MLRCSATTYILSSFFLPHSYNDLGLSKRGLRLLPQRVFVPSSDTIIVAEVGRSLGGGGRSGRGYRRGVPFVPSSTWKEIGQSLRDLRLWLPCWWRLNKCSVVCSIKRHQQTGAKDNCEPCRCDCSVQYMFKNIPRLAQYFRLLRRKSVLRVRVVNCKCTYKSVRLKSKLLTHCSLIGRSVAPQQHSSSPLIPIPFQPPPPQKKASFKSSVFFLYISYVEEFLYLKQWAS